jgi:hypothetical protein
MPFPGHPSPVRRTSFPAKSSAIDREFFHVWERGWFSARSVGSAAEVPSADLLGQLDDDSLGAADVAEPVAVLVADQLADELGAAGL